MYLNMTHYIWAELAWKSAYLHFPDYMKVSRQERYFHRDS